MSSNQTRSKAEDEQVLLFLPCLSRGLAPAGNQGFGTGGCVWSLHICKYVGIKIYIHTYTYMQTETVFLKKTLFAVQRQQSHCEGRAGQHMAVESALEKSLAKHTPAVSFLYFHEAK